MSIDWWRDLSIAVFAFVATGVMVFISVLAYSLYRRAVTVLDSQKIITANLQEISTVIKDGLKKLVQMTAIFQGLRKGIEMVLDFLKKDDKGGCHEQR